MSRWCAVTNASHTSSTSGGERLAGGLELLDEHRWVTRKQLALAIVDWIEACYKPRRRHSYCGMFSPVDYEATNAA